MSRNTAYSIQKYSFLWCPSLAVDNSSQTRTAIYLPRSALRLCMTASPGELWWNHFFLNCVLTQGSSFTQHSVFIHFRIWPNIETSLSYHRMQGWPHHVFDGYCSPTRHDISVQLHYEFRTTDPSKQCWFNVGPTSLTLWTLGQRRTLAFLHYGVAPLHIESGRYSVICRPPNLFNLCLRMNRNWETFHGVVQLLCRFMK